LGILLLKHGYVEDWSNALALITDAGYREMKANMHETVEAAHRSGGIALIAHPGRGLREPKEFTYYTPELIDQVRAEIPLDGIEVYYPTHTPEMVEN
jgi:3',5'-nucleoside bisphosphate phosphatase